jgi:uncharacterized protein YlxP (DUF503 family)
MRQFEHAHRGQDARDERKVHEQRNQLVEKVLFTEVGLTDYAKARLVALAIPRLVTDRETVDRDLRELAEFLDAHLDWEALAL